MAVQATRQRTRADGNPRHGTRRSYSFLATPGEAPSGATEVSQFMRANSRSSIAFVIVAASEPGRSGVRSSAADAGSRPRNRCSSATPSRFRSTRTVSARSPGRFPRTNKEAQAFFDQGFQMMYSFAKPEAVRSFRESWKRDPNCAICYWGEAWAWGSYLNAPMNAEEAPHAYAAIQKAVGAQGQGATRRSARSSRRWRCATSRASTPTSGSSRTAPTRTR